MKVALIVILTVIASVSTTLLLVRHIPYSAFADSAQIPKSVQRIKESAMERHQREAKESVDFFLTNQIQGFSRIVSRNDDLWDKNIGEWRSRIIAEYVNTVGGIERTNLDFNFVIETNRWTPDDGAVKIDFYKLAEKEGKEHHKAFEQWLKSLDK